MALDSARNRQDCFSPNELETASMEFKPTKPDNINQYSSGASKSKGCGCVGIGCLVSVIMLVILCVGSYFAMMHTSFPLAMIERAIEADGTARVEGLRGSISSGFEIDKLEFMAEDGKHWNEFRGVKFAFNGIFDLMRTERFVIEEASVDGATVYTDYEEPEIQNSEPEIDFNWFVEDIDELGGGFREGLEEFQHEMRQEGAGDLKEIRIDLVNIQNIEIVNPVTDDRLKIERVEFRGFRMVQGEVDNLGQITVKSDFVDVDSKPSIAFPDEKLAWQLTGSIKTHAHQSLTAPVPFAMDFAFVDDNKSAMTASLFGESIKVADPNSKIMTINVSDFSPGEYIDLGTTIVPAKWSLDITSERPEPTAENPDDVPGEQPIADEAGDKSGDEAADGSQPESSDKAEVKSVKRVVTFLPGGHFDLGKTRFEIETASFDVLSNSEPPLLLIATGMIGDNKVTAQLRSQRKAPFVFVDLSAEGMEPRDIWAQLFFERPYEELDSDAKASIDKVLVSANGNIVEPVDF